MRSLIDLEFNADARDVAGQLAADSYNFSTSGLMSFITWDFSLSSDDCKEKSTDVSLLFDSVVLDLMQIGVADELFL